MLIFSASMSRVVAFRIAVIMVFGSGAFGWGAPAGAASATPPLAELVQQFDAVAMGHEHGKRPAIIRKWAAAPNLALFVKPGFDADPYVRQIVDQVHELAQLSGLPMHLSAPGGQANLRLGFYPRADFARLPGSGSDADTEAFVATSACLGVSRLDHGQAGSIVAGAIMIGTDIDEGLRRHCLLEEMVQMMGLPNDACFYRPSLFCEDDYVSGMTKADVLLVRTLYDPRLEPGMPRAQALPIVRQILTELADQDEGDEAVPLP